MRENAGIQRQAYLNHLDRKILDLVQRDATVTADKVGTQIGLSASAALRRLRRLQDDGVIAATVAVLDPTQIGRPTTFVTALEIERERPELLDRLRRWLREEDEVQQAYYVTGGADFVLIIIARDVEAYDALMARLIAENANVRRFTTNVVLATGKRTLFIPTLDPGER